MNENGTTFDANKLHPIRYELPADTLDVLRNSICKGFSNEEFSYAAEVCRSLGLNPVKKEIWFIKIGTGIQTMTGINGYFTIANNHPMYNGMEEDVVVSEKDGSPVYAWCKVYRKDRQYPQTSKVYFKEYFDPSKLLWKSKPFTMLLKVAESVALRKAFPQELNGTYTEEEMPGEYSKVPSATKTNPMLTVGHEIKVENGSAEVIQVTPKAEAEVIAVTTSPKPQASRIDWSEYPYRYTLKGLSSKEEFQKAGQLLKQYGGKFRGKKNKDGSENPDGDNCWYSKEFVVELSKFVDDNPSFVEKVQDKYAEGDLFGGDDIKL